MTEKTEEKAVSISVKVLTSQGKTALVEWVADGVIKRGFVPAKLITAEGSAPETSLKAATPYGVPWAKLVKLSATPEGLEAALHRAGIWTLDDLRTKPQAAIGALQAAYHLDIGTLLLTAQKYEQGENL